MAAPVFINGRAAIYRDCAGQAVAFPDVCLCPPGPPAGPVPVPLPNTVVAADLAGCAATVVIDGNPVAHLKSYFAKSTGNEVSRSTGGGVVSHATQGMAFFQTGSADVFVEGKPAVRHGDLLTQNHLAMMPPNTPPSVWMSEMDVATPAAPGRVKKTLNEGKDWIALHFVDEIGEPLGKGTYDIKTPSGRQVSGRILHAGRISLRQIAKGNCEIVLPRADQRARELGLHKPAKTTGDQKAYVPGNPLRLPSGREYVVVVPYTKSLWVDLPVRVDDPNARDDEFVLESKDGGFRVVKTIADDRIHGDRSLTLEFFGLEPGKSYTLTHHLGKDLPVRTIFEDQSYEEIFPKNAVKKMHFEEPAEFGVDADMSEPWIASEGIDFEADGEEMQLHEPPPEGNGSES
jgi:uncharacterized Zn-binding protein involved in type VI secretion